MLCKEFFTLTVSITNISPDASNQKNDAGFVFTDVKTTVETSKNKGFLAFLGTSKPYYYHYHYHFIILYYIIEHSTF